MSPRAKKWFQSASQSAVRILTEHLAIAVGATIAVMVLVTLGLSDLVDSHLNRQGSNSQQPALKDISELPPGENLKNNIEFLDKNGTPMILMEYFEADLRNGRGNRFPYQGGIFQCDPVVISLGSQVTLTIQAGGRIIAIEKTKVRIGADGDLFVQSQYSAIDLRNKINSD